jgi:hypothetical protein
MAAGSHGQVRWAVRPGGATAAQEEWQALDEHAKVSFEVLFRWLADIGVIRNHDRCRPVQGSPSLWLLQHGRAVILFCRQPSETILLHVIPHLRGPLPAAAASHALIVSAEDIGGHV